jgi:hypothetical protein
MLACFCSFLALVRRRDCGLPKLPVFSLGQLFCNLNFRILKISLQLSPHIMEAVGVEATYWSLVSSQKLSYPGFVERLEKQTLWRQNTGRVAIFCAGERIPREFSTSDQLRNFLDLHPNKPGEPRIFVLEDLSKSIVEILGSRLRIPPSFFADHWEDEDGNITRWTLRHQDPHRRYMLRWQKLHQKIISDEGSDGLDPYFLPSEVSRMVSRRSLFGDSVGVTTSRVKLSYWCSRCSSFGKFPLFCSLEVNS